MPSVERDAAARDRALQRAVLEVTRHRRRRALHERKRVDVIRRGGARGLDVEQEAGHVGRKRIRSGQRHPAAVGHVGVLRDGVERLRAVDQRALHRDPDGRRRLTGNQSHRYADLMGRALHQLTGEVQAGAVEAGGAARGLQAARAGERGLRRVGEDDRAATRDPALQRAVLETILNRSGERRRDLHDVRISRSRIVRATSGRHHQAQRRTNYEPGTFTHSYFLLSFPNRAAQGIARGH